MYTTLSCFYILRALKFQTMNLLILLYEYYSDVFAIGCEQINLFPASR